MPVTNFDYRGMSQLPDVGSVLGINNINSLLSEDDDYHPLQAHRHTGSMDTKSILRAETTKEEFPILVRRPGEVIPHHSSSSMDRSMATTSGADGLPSWPSFARHRQGQQSLPMNTLRSEEQEKQETRSRAGSVFDTPNRSNGSGVNRRSIDVMFSSPLSSRNHVSPPSGMHGAIPNLRASLSTNDVATISSFNNNANSNGNGNGIGNSTAGTHAEQHRQNHNANLGRIPSGINRGSLDLSYSDFRTAEFVPKPLTSVAAPAAAPAAAPQAASTAVNGHAVTITAGSAYPPPAYPYYGQASYALTPGQAASQYTVAQPYNPYQQPAYYWQQHPQHQAQAQHQQQPHAYQMKLRDSQPLVVQARRAQNDEGTCHFPVTLNRTDLTFSLGYTKFAYTELEQLKGQIFENSKDQHGCRFLQKKIEEGNIANLNFIFPEIKDHVVELMKDNFGNYLCQKILEFATEDQRTMLINKAAPFMVGIATNQHGTRALQKMIEHITKREQVCLGLTNPHLAVHSQFQGHHHCRRSSRRRRPSHPGPQRQPCHSEMLDSAPSRRRPVHIRCRRQARSDCWHPSPRLLRSPALH
jgi:hypothetical protein